MIQKARFQNFKSLRDVEITFDSRLTVLVGRNGTGKTSVLHGLRLLAGVATGQLGENNLFGGSLPLTDFFSGTPDRHLVVEGWQNEGAGPDARGVRITANPQGFRSNSLGRSTQIEVIRFVGDSSFPEGQSVAVPDRAKFGPAAMPAFDPSGLSQPTHTTSTPPGVEANGRGLSSLLTYLKLSEEEIYDAVQKDFQAVMKRPIKLRPNRVGAPGHSFAESLTLELPGGTRVPASAMSEGTLYLLGLITLIRSPNRPLLLLLDHLDGTLHPGAQLDLVDLLHRLLDLFPDLQIVATAHSPYVLDRLRPEEVRLLSLDADGHTRCRPMADHPEFQRWKSMTPGEFWGTFYEDDPAERLAALQTAG